MKLYVGILKNGMRSVFRDPVEPIQATHGWIYTAVIGPFRTLRGARFMADHGRNNPHVQCVEDAERLAPRDSEVCCG